MRGALTSRLGRPRRRVTFRGLVRRLSGVGGALVAATALVAGPASAESPFARCRAAFAARPLDYDSSYCFFQVAQQEKRWDEAARLLDALRAAHPRNHWLTLARGNVEWTRDPERAESFYRVAAAGFATEGSAEGEVLARHNLRTILYRKGRLDEAGREVERALAAAEASGQDVVLARSLALQAVHLTDTGQDVSAAYASLRRAERAAFPSGPYTLRRSILFALGNACFQLGRLEEAVDYYRRVEAMTAETEDHLTRASAQYNVVNTLLRQLEDLPKPGARAELLDLARAALDTAAAADNREIQVMLHRTLGELLGARGGPRAESRAHYERCVALARSIRQPRELAHCLWSLAGHLAEEGRPSEARRRIDEALSLAAQTGHVWSLAHASRQRMRVSWATRPRDEAVAESLRSLDAIEAVRDLQQEEGGAAEVFSAWVRDYKWLAGHLLQDRGDAPSRGDLERAFVVVERMRARTLLDALRAANAEAGRVPGHLEAERRRVLRRIVDLHRGLLDPATSAEGRRELAASLDPLEAEERRLRAALSISSPHGGASEVRTFASLGEVERQLGPREALLSYEVGLDEDAVGDAAGGAWVTVSTRSGTVARPISDRVRLHEAVPVFLGLFAARDGREIVPSTVLYREVLEPALAVLPPGVDRLVVVPDDVLHRLPFAALRADPEAPPLGASFEVTLAPSATLWLRWRRAPPVAAPRPALVLADPTRSVELSGGAGPAAVRGWLLDSGEPFGPLPHARREGRQVARRLGGSTLWIGEAASEARLKSARLDEFSLLHFGAHAWVDEEHPDRSSILLAPGDAAQDGLLQAREIMGLPLAGRVVVLAACRSAGGSLLEGEGLLSLARAFFQAGAHAVVGSLWPLRDDEAAELLDFLYRHLAAGKSLGAALRGAQNDAIDAGLPPAAWAGLVVAGDGALVPYPGGPRSAPGWPAWLLAACAALGAGAGGAWIWRRHAASRLSGPRRHSWDGTSKRTAPSVRVRISPWRGSLRREGRDDERSRRGRAAPRLAPRLLASLHRERACRVPPPLSLEEGVMPAARLKSFLDENAVRYETLQHVTAYTSQGVAAAAHVRGNEVAKTVVLKVDGRYVLAVVPAPSRVDLDRFRAVAGANTVVLAPESDLYGLFPGCDLGAEPPFGNLYGLSVWVDEKLATDPSIVFNAGTHTEAVRMDYADFDRLVHPKVARFGRP